MSRVEDVQSEDSGNYTCEVHGTSSTVLASVVHHLFVRAAVEMVRITTELPEPGDVAVSRPTPSVIRLVEGRPATLVCTAVGGYPPPRLQLLVDGRVEPLSTESAWSATRLRDGSGRGLRLIYVTSRRSTTDFRARPSDDRVDIKCLATVPELPASVANTSLEVDYSPQIVCHEAEAELGERNVCVRCDVRAKPRATSVFWVVADNGRSVRAGEVTDDFWAVVKDRRDGVMESCLYVVSVSLTSFRHYTAVAENDISVSRQTTRLTERIAVPSKPLSDEAPSDTAVPPSPDSALHRKQKHVLNADTTQHVASSMTSLTDHVTLLLVLPAFVLLSARIRIHLLMSLWVNR